MPVTRASTFKEAVDALNVRSLLPTSLSSQELQDELEAEFRERAFFSARVTKVEILQNLAQRVRALVAGTTDHATQRLGIKDLLKSIDYQPTEADRGTIKDLSTDARINLMLSTNVQQAQGYGAWMQGQHPAVLDEWPAQELYRAEARKAPRTWPAIWRQHNGPENGGKRQIALKDDPIWEDISRFGTPYPPFDYNSGMDVRDVDRDEAERLGLIKPDQQLTPQNRGFNDDLSFDPDVRSSALHQALEEAGLNFDPEGVMHLGNYRSDQPRHPKGHARGGKWSIDPNSARQQKLRARVQKAADNLARENDEKARFRVSASEFDAWKRSEAAAISDSHQKALRDRDHVLAASLAQQAAALNASSATDIHQSPLFAKFRDQTLARREAAADEAHVAADAKSIADHLPRRRIPLHNYGTETTPDSIARAVHPQMTVAGSGRNLVFKIGAENISVSAYRGNVNHIYAMDAGKSGKHLYAAADAWARRNGLVNEASGLTRINQTRRTTNMLNSSLDLGGTGHLQPYSLQRLTSFKTPPSTRQEDRVNLASLALAEKRNVMTAHPELRSLRWNAQSRKVVDRNGTEVDHRALSNLLKGNDPNFRRYGIGTETAQRAIQTNTVVRRRHPSHP